MSDVQIRVDTRAVEKALAKLDDRSSRREVQAALKVGATDLAKHVKAAAPVGKTRRLRKSISAHAAKRDKPGMIVRPRPKVAPHRHLVIKGTAERFNRAGASRGHMPANPFVDRAADRHGDATLSTIERKLADALELE